MKNRILIVLLLLFYMTNCKEKYQKEEKSLPSSSREIRIAGAFALSPLMQKWIKEYQKSHPAVKFNLVTQGSGQGLEALMHDKIDLAMVSGEISENIDSVLWVIPVVRLAVVPVINQKNPYLSKILKTGIKKDELSNLFSANNPESWGELFGDGIADPVNVYYRSDSSGATDVLARFLWLSSNEFKGKCVDGEKKMLEAIKNDVNGLGYCNFRYTFNSESKQFLNEIKIIPLDLNNNGKIDGKEDFYNTVTYLQRAMWTGRYPCSLTRTISLASKGKPATKELNDFLIWILTEGQRSVAREGYIELHSFQIPPYLYSLNN